MEFKCRDIKCGKIFRPHRYIGFRHPSLARCPECGKRGYLTKKGIGARKSRFHEMNKSKYTIVSLD